MKKLLAMTLFAVAAVMSSSCNLADDDPYSAENMAARYGTEGHALREAFNDREIDREIRYVLGRVQETVKDVTGDGEVNCQDYSLCFYYWWNKNATHTSTIMITTNHYFMMNHAFIGIKFPYNVNGVVKYKTMYIEPQCKPNDNYLMEHAWNSIEYNPKYNKDNTKSFIYRFGYRIVKELS